MSFHLQRENDLKTIIEGDFGLPVILVSPDGVEYSKSFLDAEKDLVGKIDRSTFSFNPDNGESVIVQKPVISIRINSLERVPKDGEKWVVKIPEKNQPTDAKIDYVLCNDKAVEMNTTIGYVKLYLMKVIQV